jgi:hypothetical protein
MEENDNSSSALMEIQQIITESKKQFELLNDCNKQLFNMANTVDEYVIQVLQTVAENEDIASVNETLANSLLQIKNFVSSRPNEIGLTKLKLEQRLIAYEQCMTILYKGDPIIVDKETVDFQVKSEEVLAAEKKNRIADRFDKDGKYPSRRPKGARPEKLRDIRRVEAQIETSKNFKEDI